MIIRKAACCHRSQRQIERLKQRQSGYQQEYKLRKRQQRINQKNHHRRLFNLRQRALSRTTGQLCIKEIACTAVHLRHDDDKKHNNADTAGPMRQAAPDADAGRKIIKRQRRRCTCRRKA